MTVYIDNTQAILGKHTVFCMIADTKSELCAMAKKLGPLKLWNRGDHFHVDLSKRAFAVAMGAVEIDQRQCAQMVEHRRTTGLPAHPMQ